MAKKKVARRTYSSKVRRESAETTRSSILEAARTVFLERGYAAATMPLIAKSAGIALDTIYATMGRKPALFRLLVETALSGADVAVPAEERDYVKAIRAEPDTGRKLQIYSAALRSIQGRLAPLFRVLQGAAALDPELDALWGEISQRRARNMRLFAEDLAATGRLREGVSVDEVADVIWSMNSSEFYLLLVEERRWSPEKFERWLSDAWTHLFLKP
jgi:AcrR family transcriptional regulator